MTDQAGGNHDTVQVLFVCVHNAARSRMAEALLRSRVGDRFEVTSAGFEPREVNPLVIEALSGVNKRVSWSFPDPSAFTGTYEEKRARVVDVRDAIGARIDEWLRSLRIGTHTA